MFVPLWAGDEGFGALGAAEEEPAVAGFGWDTVGLEGDGA